MKHIAKKIKSKTCNHIQHAFRQRRAVKYLQLYVHLSVRRAGGFAGKRRHTYGDNELQH